MLLIWSAIVLVDIHCSNSRSQKWQSFFTAAFHISGSRSAGFFLRSRVSWCGGWCMASLLANSSSSAGWMKFELLKTAQQNDSMMFSMKPKTAHLIFINIKITILRACVQTKNEIGDTTINDEKLVLWYSDYPALHNSTLYQISVVPKLNATQQKKNQTHQVHIFHD